MPGFKRWIAVSMIALAGAALVGAEPSTPKPPVDQEATVVQELVVTAKLRGPAWWRVSNGSSIVYVMGVPGALPKGMGWDATVLQHRLAGANVMIDRPQLSVGLGDLLPLWSASRKFRADGQMDAALPPDLRARFMADRATLSHDSNAYEKWTPALAGLQMVGDFRKQTGFDNYEPGKTITRLAHKQGVKVKPIGVYRFLPVMRAAEGQLAGAGPACMDDALHEIEMGAGPMRAAAEGWARGDVAASLRAERGYEKCLSRFPEGAALVGQTTTDAVSAIAAALNQPGHSVAIVNLRTLLSQGGVLQQLKARGYAVATPDQP